MRHSLAFQVAPGKCQLVYNGCNQEVKEQNPVERPLFWNIKQFQSRIDMTFTADSAVVQHVGSTMGGGAIA